MSHIWNSFSDEITYQIAESGEFSPYAEVLDIYDEKIRKVNVLYRLAEEFRPLLAIRQQQEEALPGMENLMLTFIADLDRTAGVCLQDFKMLLLREELDSGRFGEEIRSLFAAQPERVQLVILHWMLIREQENAVHSFLWEVLRDVFSDELHQCILYRQESRKRFLFYSAQKGTPERCEAFRLIQLLFLDIGEHVDAVWQYHFGFIGNDSAMKADAIQIL